MRVLCINVSIRPESKVIYIPLGLSYIATAIKRQGYDLTILDIDAQRYSEEYIEQYLKKNKFDVICLGCIITGYKYIKKLSALIKQIDPHTKIIVGNSVASSIPLLLLTKTDSDIAVTGEGDITIIEILKALKESRDLKEVKGIYYKDNGKIIKTQDRPPIENIDEIPFPDWDLFDIEKYIESCSLLGASDPVPLPRDKLKAFAVSTARGCPFACTFCYQVFRGNRYRYISPDVLVKEINKLKKKYRLNYFIFHDDLTLLSKKHIRDLSECFLKENVDVFWIATCRAEVFKENTDIELVKLLKQAGCAGLSYSLENASPEILAAMNKKIKPDDFLMQSRILGKAGIPKWTSLVFGYPQETPETIKKTFDYCIESEIYPSAGYLLPLPGAPIYDYAKSHGFINNEEEYLMRIGDRQDLWINMTKMSNSEFQGCVLEGLERCNKKLKIGLDKNELIKTQYYRSKK